MELNTHESLQREEIVKGSSDRTFGLVFAIFFSLVGLLPLLHRRPIRIWALIVAAGFLAVTLVSPALLRPLNHLWQRLGLLLHTITNPLILGALFYLIFTPFAIVLRLLGKDYLRLRWDDRAESYWLQRTPPGPPPESMSNQF